MSQPIPTCEPTQIRAGDTVQWTVDRLTDYKPADGWSLTYYIAGAGGVLVQTATTSGQGYAVTLTAAQTGVLIPGDYAIEGKVSMSPYVFTVYSARLCVLVNMATATTSTDTRSFNRRVRDALRALTESIAPDPTQAYTIFGERAVTLMTAEERMKMLALYEDKVLQEERSATANSGQRTGIYMRFRNPV